MSDSSYSYVNVRYPGMSTWARIRIDQIHEYFEKSGGKDFLVSMQQYKSPVETDDEIYTSDFYIDIDVKGNLDKAIKATQSIVQYLWEVLKVSPPYPRVWFSGQKGFHISIHKEILGIKPHAQLQQMFRVATEQMSRVLNIKDIDSKIYTKKRLLRWPNSIHPDTGLHKIEITHEELMTLSAAQIMDMAKEPRGQLPIRMKFYPVDPSTESLAWWASILKSWNNQVQHAELKPRKMLKIDKSGNMPTCMKYLLSGPAPDGHRNKATFVMASFFAGQGYSQKKTMDLLVKWVEDHYTADGTPKLRERIANTEAVVRTVYDNGYSFICSVCQNIDPSHSYCDGIGKCSFVETPEDQEPAAVPVVELSRASNAIYYGKTIRCPVHVCGVADRPYVIPKKLKAYCDNPPCGDDVDGDCIECPLLSKSIDYVVSMKTPILLKFIEVEDVKAFGNMRTMMGIPKCKHAVLEQIDRCNLQMLVMNPMVDSQEESKRLYHDQSNGVQNSEYVTRVGYFLGHDVKTNQAYYITNTVFADPNNAKVVHLIDHLEPATSTLESFNPSEAILEGLRMFQQGDLQTVEDKFNEIHNDFEANVHKITKRRIWAFAVDITYHSPLSFYFFDEYVHKGWMETVCVGDTAQGKTALARAMMNHFQVGGWTSAEGEGRTGLGYSKQQISVGKGGSQWFVGWGTLPQNDRGLLNVDEFAGVKEDDFAQLTDARDQGVIESSGVVKRKTHCRTRTIYMSNAKSKVGGYGQTFDGGSLGQYTYGIEAVAGLYRDHQDLRRVDLAVAVKKGDVSIDELNTVRKLNVPKRYTSEMCKNLVLWAWSRTAKQITWEDGAEDAVLQAAIRISNKYATPKMNLVDPSTQKLKVARVSIAIAMRLFSTDDHYNDVIVRKEHVDFAEKMFYTSYDSPGMQYDVYAMHNRDVPNIPDAEKDEIMSLLISSTMGKRHVGQILKTLVQVDRVDQSALIAAGMKNEIAKDVMISFRERDLVDANGRKTPTGVDLFKDLFHRNKRK
jgi:hypothetical protein